MKAAKKKLNLKITPKKSGKAGVGQKGCRD
jgi:hypothetical protein